MKNISLVSPSFLKQKARQLKKEKSLTQNQALNEAARQLGYANYKNYLNFLKSNSKQLKLSKEDFIKKISAENVISKKMDLSIAFIQNFKPSFCEHLDILKLFQHSHELGHHPEFEWLDDVHFVCEKLNLMEDEIQKYLLNDFLTDEGKIEVDDTQQYAMAKEVSVRDLTYEIKENMLYVDGIYDLKTQFDFEAFEAEVEAEVSEEDRKDEYFDTQEQSGSFGVTIDGNENFTLVHSDIGWNSDSTMMGRSR